VDASGRVVAGEDDDRVVGEARLVDAVHDLPDAVVHLGEEVRILSQPRRIRLVEVRVHRLRRMHVR